ncbi:DUF4445 domain-containing protein [bacterium]|nr:DUF4445 domain-containing protein [bacterium]
MRILCPLGSARRYCGDPVLIMAAADAIQLQVETVKGRHEVPVAADQRGWRLTEILRHRHLPLNTRCGQKGLCDGCVLELLEGQLVHVASGKAIEGSGQPQSLRGCEYRLGDSPAVRVHVPARSLLAYEPQVVSDFKVKVPRAQDPLWQPVAVPATELQDGATLEHQLCQAVARRCQRRRPVRLDPNVAARLTRPPPGGHLCVTTEYREDHWLITDLCRDGSCRALGVAIDIGTTTVALLLVDLDSGEVIGSAANFNRQIHLGDDVLTRINLCSTDPAQTAHLQKLVVAETIAPLIQEVLQGAGESPDQVRCITAAGNSTMLHLFAGVDPSSMGVAPFTPVFLEHRVRRAGGLGLAMGSGPDGSTLDPTVHLLPGAAAYVGADLTAGAFATGLVYEDGPCLLVDVGTNGEIILKKDQHLFGCATAAGPAFEGAGLTSGVRATAGAISHLQLTADPFTVKTEIIGKHAPIGLCGTAYIDFLSQARRLGLLSPTGRFQPDAVPGADERIIPWKDYGWALRVGYAPGRQEIVIAETDIAKLLQAKAAIAAGILTLLEKIGLQSSDVKTLHLAGGFGLHMDRAHAIGCGLLPGFVPEQIEVVGNTSLAGAYLGLLDCGALDEIGRCGRQMEVIELNLDPGFEDRYIEQLALPG